MPPVEDLAAKIQAERKRQVEEGLEQDLAALLEDGSITEGDADAVRDFQRFLAVATRETNGGKLLLPAEWIPYATGTGPAP